MKNDKTILIADYEQLWHQLRDRLSRFYNAGSGSMSMDVLITSILKDFAGMLEKARPGDTVSETYRTEDGKAEVFLQTVMTIGGSTVFVEVKPQK